MNPSSSCDMSRVLQVPKERQGGGGGGGITPIGTVSTAATGVKIFDRRILALTTSPPPIFLLDPLTVALHVMILPMHRFRHP